MPFLKHVQTFPDGAVLLEHCNNFGFGGVVSKVAFLLEACDEVLLYVEDEGKWRNAIDANLGYHKACLSSKWPGEHYMC